MSFKKYEAYKESGVEWLGEIPSHWLCISLKNIEPYNSQMVQTGPFGAQLHASDYVDEGVPLILIKNVRNLAIDDSDIPKISTEDAKRLSIYSVEVGDIVFSRVGSIGRIAKITEKERGWLISGQMLRLRLGSNLLNPAYSVYTLSSKIVEDYVTYYSVGSTRDSINTEILMNLKIPLPSLEEQKQIVKYLDKETTKTDILIDKQEQLITLLQEKRQAIISHAVTRGLNPNVKMKDSGIEWLGEVPEHWEAKRLKFCVQLTDQKIEANREKPLPYVGLENIQSWTGKLLPIDPNVVPTSVANRFGKGMTLFGKLRPYLAKACNPDFEGLCSTELLVFKSTGFDQRLLLHLLLTDGFIKAVDSSTYGAKMPRANWDFIGNCIVPVPPLEEQKQIAAFLNKETTKNDTLIEKCETAIELLKERRTALISAAVTGKIDVRNAV